MVYLARWKIILIVSVCLWGMAFSVPNLLPRPAQLWLEQHMPGFLPHQIINLGLDLRGGSHLLLEVAVDEVITERVQGVLDQVRVSLRAAKIAYTDLKVVGGAVEFRPSNPDDGAKAKDVVREIDRAMDVSIRDGVIVTRLTDTMVAERKRAAMEQSIEIVRRRIDETGTREPSIQQQGDNRILVQLPGIDDPGHIKNLLGQTAKLSFRLVDEGASMTPNRAYAPAGTEILPYASDAHQKLVVQKRVMVSGETLVDAQPSFQDGQPVVNFKFDAVGARRFGEVTRNNVGHLFAIILDDKVISAPVIRDAILGGSGVISGNFTTASANDLALLLRAGALPAPITVVEERTVGPGLGADSIKAGAVASVVGLGLVVVFFTLSYGLFGLFANIALLLNIALIFAVLTVLQATLTLPGIAGIVLTIGAALDANVLVFERMREEQRLGRQPISAVDAGYQHALSAIVDANMTTLIAAILLLAFGSGPIKGFGVTLTIGIVTSIFSAVMVTRLIIVTWLHKTKPKTLPL